MLYIACLKIWKATFWQIITVKPNSVCLNVHIYLYYIGTKKLANCAPVAKLSKLHSFKFFSCTIVGTTYYKVLRSLSVSSTYKVSVTIR